MRFIYSFLGILFSIMWSFCITLALGLFFALLIHLQHPDATTIFRLLLGIGIFLAGFFLFRWLLRYIIILDTKRALQNLKVDEISMISIPDENGFSLVRIIYDGNIEKEITTKNKRVRWLELERIKLDPSNKSLILGFKNQTTQQLGNDLGGWHELLFSLPTHLISSSDYEYIQALKGQLQPCKGCGAIAVLKDECLHCSTVPWDYVDQSKYKDELHYLREEQLEIFATDEEDEAIDYEVVFYQKDPDWQLLVTEEEVLDYSAVEYW